jgi:hypothetical protein
MVYGGILGGLANLGQIYGGYEQQQDADLRRQVLMQQLQSFKLQQQTNADILKAFGGGPLSLQQPQPIQQPGQTQPSPGAGTGMPPSGGGGLGGGGGSFLPQVPSYGASPFGGGAVPPSPQPPALLSGGLSSGFQFPQQAPMPPLGGPMPQLGGGIPQVPNYSGAMPPTPPATPFAGNGAQTLYDQAVFASGQTPTGISGGPGDMWRTGLPQQTGGMGFPALPQAPDFTSLGSAASGPSSGTMAPSAAGTDTGAPPRPDLGGQLRTLPQFDALGSTRPFGPGEYVMNKNGSWSSEYSVTVEDPRQPGRYMVVPSLWLQNGKPTILSEDQAAQTAAQSGLNFPTFDSEQAAEAFANQRENIWQQTPVGRSDAQTPLWSQGGAGVPGTGDQGGVAQAPGTADGRVPLPAVQNAIYGIESSYGQDTSTSRAGAVGPMQVVPKDYPQYDANRLTNDPQYNRAAGNQIVANLYQKYGGNPYLTAIAYSAGERRADAVANGAPISSLPAETQNYVAKMQRNLGGGVNVGAAHAEMNNATTPQQRAAGTYGAQALIGRWPETPKTVSMMETGQQLAQMIQQRLPGATDEEKGAVFLKLFPMMNEMAQQDTAQKWKVWQAQFDERKADIEAARLGQEPLGGPVQTPTGGWVQPMRAGAPVPLPGVPEGATKTVDEPLGGPVQTPAGDWVQPMRTGSPRPLPGAPASAERGTGGIFQQGGKTFQITPQGTVREIQLPGEGPLTRAGAPDQTGRAPEMDPQKDTMAKGIAEYRIAPLSGWALRTPWGKQTMENVLALNPEYESTEYGARQSAARGFAAGRQGDAIRFVNVAYDHLAIVDELTGGLAQGDTRRLNQLRNVLKTEFGYEGPIDFEAAKVIVGDEVSKAVIGGVGSLADRQALQNQLNAANSPEQLKGVSITLKRLMMSQLGGLRRQYETTTGKTDFDEKLSPAAKTDLDAAAVPRTPRSAPGQPQVGTEEDGMIFRGGDPADPKNWTPK